MALSYKTKTILNKSYVKNTYRANTTGVKDIITRNKRCNHDTPDIKASQIFGSTWMQGELAM
jgi:hypothetical protein